MATETYSRISGDDKNVSEDGADIFGDIENMSGEVLTYIRRCCFTCREMSVKCSEMLLHMSGDVRDMFGDVTANVRRC